MGCVKLPYADAPAYGNIQYSVGDQISPLEWYALIKYSKGYIGNNMHPIVTAIANGVPFYSFDNYGILVINGKETNGESSKIFHILNKAGLLKNRAFVAGKKYEAPSPREVLDGLLNFDCDLENDFSSKYLLEYLKMMDSVYNAIRK